MRTFKMTSAQTGMNYGSIVAETERAALDKFAQDRGYANVRAMWDAGQFEYICAVQA
jgi:hypothetical protein